MLVANSFDLWQKDIFFSAAEEVQESADRMESTYRMWIREKREGIRLGDLHELSRELQAALGTAKWQLEEFEKAVRLSHGNCRDDNITATRHKQFVDAMENQISRVEAALGESLCDERKQPLRWVNLDEEECNDLAMFLSGTSISPIDEGIKLRPSVKRNEAELSSNVNCSGDYTDETKSHDKEADCVIDIEGKGTPTRKDDSMCQTDKTRRTWSSPNFGALKIVIADKDEERHTVGAGIEATPKPKGSKPFFWMQRCREHHHSKRVVNLVNQLYNRVSGSRRHLQSPTHLQMKYSPIRLTLALMLTVFLIVPFLFYST